MLENEQLFTKIDKTDSKIILLVKTGKLFPLKQIFLF